MGDLTAKVLEYERIVKDLCARAKRPGYSREDWAELTALVAVDDFERVGIHRETMSWSEYLDFMVPWAEAKEFDTRHRRITEVGDLVFFEIEEHHLRDGQAAVVNSMNVYQFDLAGRICHLDVYLQGGLGGAAFQPA